MNKPPTAPNVKKPLPPRPIKPAFKPQDYARSNIPLPQIQQLKQAFDLFDFNQQGKLDPKQLKNALNNMNMQAKNGTFYNAVVSIQKQGPIDFSKFIEIMTARTGVQKTRANVKKIFALFDDEKTGFISQKNLKKVVKDVGMSTLSDKQLNEMIDKSDLDNDGLVSQEQFYLIMTKKSKKY